MATMFQTFLLVMMTMMLLLGQPLVDAKMLAMRPLNAQQVYRLLHEAGRSDAIPQGRVITQGLAAVAGFALGLTKGLGTALLFDIITANVTAADLGLTLPNTGSSTPSTIATQEVCFNSRSARSLAEAAAVAEVLSRDDDKKADQNKVRQSEVDRRVTKKRRNKRKKKKSKRGYKKPDRMILTKPKSDADDIGRQPGSGGFIFSGSPTATASSPTSTPTTPTSPISTGTGGVTNTGTGTDPTGTTSLTTSSGDDGAINCIVLQKPARRKR